MQGRQREYYRNDEATAGTWQDGWLYSGDLARLDEDGYLYIVGRKKDVIIRGGNNIHAVDVEAVLLDHPDVMEAAVVGIPHAVLGEDVAAVVVLAPGHCRPPPTSSGPTAPSGWPTTRSPGGSSSSTSCPATPPARS